MRSTLGRFTAALRGNGSMLLRISTTLLNQLFAKPRRKRKCEGPPPRRSTLLHRLVLHSFSQLLQPPTALATEWRRPPLNLPSRVDQAGGLMPALYGNSFRTALMSVAGRNGFSTYSKPASGLAYP